MQEAPVTNAKEAGQYSCPTSHLLKTPFLLPPFFQMCTPPQNNYSGNAGNRDSINTEDFEEEDISITLRKKILEDRIVPG